MNEKKCVLVQSKVSLETAELLDAIVEKYNFKSRYDILQYVLSAFLRVVDCDGKISAEDKELLEFSKMFEGFENAKNRVITVRPSSSRNKKLVDSINIYSEVGSRGYTCKQLSIYGDDVHTNASVNKALETLLKKLHNELYLKLREIAQEEGETRLERIINMLADEHQQGHDSNHKYISETFNSNDGSPEYGKVPQRRVNKHSYDE